MKAFVGITDCEWFDLLSGLPQFDDVNFWQPGANSQFPANLRSPPVLGLSPFILSNQTKSEFIQNREEHHFIGLPPV